MMSPSDAVDMLAQVRAAKARLAQELKDQTGIVGIGIGRDEGGLLLKVNVASAKDRKNVPESVEGVPVKVEVVGRLRPE